LKLGVKIVIITVIAILKLGVKIVIITVIAIIAQAFGMILL